MPRFSYFGNEPSVFLSAHTMSQIMSNQNVHQKLNAVYYNRASHEKTSPSVSRRAFILLRSRMPNHPPRHQSSVTTLASHRIASPPHPTPRAVPLTKLYSASRSPRSRTRTTPRSPRNTPCPAIRASRGARIPIARATALSPPPRGSLATPGTFWRTETPWLVRVVPPLARCDARHRPRPASRAIARVDSLGHAPRATRDRRSSARSVSIDRRGCIDRCRFMRAFHACMHSIDRSRSVSIGLDRSVSIVESRPVPCRAVRWRLARSDASTDHDSTACPSRHRTAIVHDVSIDRGRASGDLENDRSIRFDRFDPIEHHPIDRSIESIDSIWNDRSRATIARSIDNSRTHRETVTTTTTTTRGTSWTIEATRGVRVRAFV